MTLPGPALREPSALAHLSEKTQAQILELEASRNNRIVGYIWRCAFTRLDTSKSQMIFGEVFLWGCQTAQLSSGVDPKSPKFIVDARLVLNRRATKVLGWQLKMKDGSSEFMRYNSTSKSPAKAGEIFLRAVIGRRKK